MSPIEDPRTREEIAALLEAEPGDLPHLPELLADLDALGSWPDVIVDLLRPLGLGPRARVLDLGCGKGAVALAVAEALPVQVLGVDAFLPFVETARRLADSRDLVGRCRFELGDLKRSVESPSLFDVVILASIGPIFGGVGTTIERLLGAVRPDGWIVIDDSFLVQQATDLPPAYDDYLTLDATRAAMRSAGVTIVREVVIPRARLREANERNNAAIRKRAELLARRRPDAADTAWRFVERQEAECRFLDAHTGSAVWLLQR